ncbi:AraC family transcriptional regulator [Paenibacillus graminis]|uniref:AraC family transcriptional regulator n=1 Tax=Paenibacillus graminis TaxID=189425 RepID=UPI002DBFD07E|nr:GyrI-like domain-containing protein [Paenibacillus graminis]MEC0172333.1 GyrI-like domain-containing protein [Paenibacillus graminis]
MVNNRAIGKAIVFIENSLYEPIAACDVAKAVSYSYYHFHRYFQGIMGETIGSYIRTRRLTQAAWDLVHSERKILDIGVSLYFETAESFTRAFKDRYGITPTEYRNNGIDVLIGNRPPALLSDNRVHPYANLSPQIVTVPETYTMGIRFITTISGNESIAMWQLFNQQIPDTFVGTRYGIFEAGETCSSDVFNPRSETTAFVGIEFPKGQPTLRCMERKKLCGGKYAKFIHKGTVKDLMQTYHYIWGVWFPKSGYELDNRDDFECYTERFAGEDVESSEIDIYFPIK